MKTRAALAAAFAASLTTNASALPSVGKEAPNVRVADVDGRALELSQLRGKPVLLVYENQEATKQNVALKSELSKRATGEAYRKSIALVAVADVDGYDYWPARGFVKRAIRAESKKLGSTIYVDWDGSVRKNAGFTKGKSTVMLLGADGKVLFSQEGTLDAANREALFKILEAQVKPAKS